MAVPETDQDVPAPVEVPPKKRGFKTIILVMLALVILGGGAFWYIHNKAKSKSAPDAVAVNAPALYFPLDPAFVVNFQGNDDARYLQVGVTIMTRDAAAIQAIKDNDPVIRNALLMLFSSQTVAQLSSTAGKQKLQADALAAIRKIVADKNGRPALQALYFTSFVMQ